jgi:hypothetical protein
VSAGTKRSGSGLAGTSSKVKPAFICTLLGSPLSTLQCMCPRGSGPGTCLPYQWPHGLRAARGAVLSPAAETVGSGPTRSRRNACSAWEGARVAEAARRWPRPGRSRRPQPPACSDGARSGAPGTSPRECGFLPAAGAAGTGSARWLCVRQIPLRPRRPEALGSAPWST